MIAAILRAVPVTVMAKPFDIDALRELANRLLSGS